MKVNTVIFLSVLRWENWLQYTQSRLVPKFTERGFDVITTPKFVQDKLKAAVQKSLSKGLKNIRTEGNVDVIWNPPGLDPKFIDLGSLTWDTIENLKTYHEQWVGGIELVPTSAYGIRLYQNESTLVMHYDRVWIGRSPYFPYIIYLLKISSEYFVFRFKHMLYHPSSMSLMSMTTRMNRGRYKLKIMMAIFTPSSLPRDR